MKPYYQQTPREVLQSTKTSVHGLTQKEAEERLKRQGKNRLAIARTKPRFLQFLKQFCDPMVAVLLVAALLSAGISLYRKDYGELLDAGVIFFIVCTNALLGFLQERKAEAAMNGLKSRNKPFAKVYRDRVLTKIPSENLVTGDVVLLEAGDEIPADIRLIESYSLKAEESALTGESFAEEKQAERVYAKDVPLADRKNFLYSSGTVTYGRGKGVVCETGMRTETGKIARLLTDVPEDTPLQKQLKKTAKVLSVSVLLIAAVIFVAAILQKDTFFNA